MLMLAHTDDNRQWPSHHGHCLPPRWWRRWWWAHGDDDEDDASNLLSVGVVPVAKLSSNPLGHTSTLCPQLLQLANTKIHIMSIKMLIFTTLLKVCLQLKLRSVQCTFSKLPQLFLWWLNMINRKVEHNQCNDDLHSSFHAFLRILSWSVCCRSIQIW